MDALTVEIVTPEASIFSGRAKEVLLPAWEGELGVLPDHDALLTLVKAGRAVVYTTEGTRHWIIGRGFADLGQDHVTLLTDRAVPIEQVDKAEATKLLAEAHETMNTDQIQTEAYKQAQLRAEWAQALLDA